MTTHRLITPADHTKDDSQTHQNLIRQEEAAAEETTEATEEAAAGEGFYHLSIPK